jgi:hypothetical protein
MPDPLTYPNVEPESGGRPRWVKLAVIIVAIVLLLVLTVLLLGGGHTPRFLH